MKYCTNLEKSKKLVRYHYPNDVRSLYAKDFDRKRGKRLVGGKTEVFSTEKERSKLPMQGRSPTHNPEYERAKRENEILDYLKN